MATQRLTVATLVGESAITAAALFDSWRSACDPAAVDRLCATLRDNGTALPVLYFCEWIDRWLMGNFVPGPDPAQGRMYQAACLSPEQALAWAEHCGHQFPEQEWLAARLREAVGCWPNISRRAIVVIRQVLDGSTTDAEVEASLSGIPDWLLSLRSPG
jgi:hypothetical protein